MNGRPLFSEKYLKPHPHTYWLKYFILHHINSNKMPASKIVDIFHRIGNYSESLVNLILLSLAEVKHGRLIRPRVNIKSDGEVSVVGLETTPRGKAFIAGEKFWDFEYLAAIVEDTWLELPIHYHDDFKGSPGFDYIGFSTLDKYNTGLKNFLINKTNSIFLFLLILEESLKLEMESKKDLFDLLIKYNIELPDFKNIRNRCAESIANAAEELPQEEALLVLSNLENSNYWLYRKRLTSRLFNLKSKQDMRTILQNCYL
jgi:hypothetical protein